MSSNVARGSRWLAALAIAAMPIAASAQEPAPQPQTSVQGLFNEPNVIVRAIDFATRTMGDGSGEKSGFYPEMSNMITGAGWISLGPGYRMWFGGDRLLIDGSAAMSWREYKMARGRIELANLANDRVAIGSELKWQDYTQNTFFGEGSDSLESNRSEYRIKSFDAIGYANVRPKKWLTVGGRSGWLRSPDLSEPRGKFRRDNPSTQDVFPDNAVFERGEQPDYLHSELFVLADTRDRRSHPLDGGLCRASWSYFSDRSAGDFSFGRLELEGAQFKTFEAARLTFAAHGWLARTDSRDGNIVPLYLLPALGGNNTLRSFANYRFHDRNMVVANVEMRVAVWDHLDAAAFVDAGNVAARMSDLDFAKRSYGAGIRLHSAKATFARLDVAHGSEGWRLTFNTSDPLHLSRLARRMAPVPFVP
jgi:outer membrane protein assembly factor BamA